MPSTKRDTPSKPSESELRPDGWQRFEKAVDAAVRSKPKGTSPKPSRRCNALPPEGVCD